MEYCIMVISEYHLISRNFAILRQRYLLITVMNYRLIIDFLLAEALEITQVVTVTVVTELNHLIIQLSIIDSQKPSMESHADELLEQKRIVFYVCCGEGKDTVTGLR